ncbi:hypothetical protein CK516_25645 [Nostoc sp. 'Peltigera malacea cyanobiont' DB3992]|nr:hypothetical protein CK516_25645 [Nostoc sp. 'Peltigera malacea cyanobiont' DB3992]
MSEKFFCIHLNLADPPKFPLKSGDFKTLISPFFKGSQRGLLYETLRDGGFPHERLAWVRGDKEIFDTSQTSS